MKGCWNKCFDVIDPSNTNWSKTVRRIRSSSRPRPLYTHEREVACAWQARRRQLFVIDQNKEGTNAESKDTKSSLQ